MFGFLKKKISESVEKLTKRAAPVQTERPAAERAEKHVAEKKGLKERLVSRIAERSLTDRDIDDFFSETELGLLEANVAFEVADSLRDGLKKRLAGKPINRLKAGETVKKAFEESIAEILESGGLMDFEAKLKAAKNEGRPSCWVFLGFNGSGKTTTIAKVAVMLRKGGHEPVVAAADTFRAASIEQLEHHASKIGFRVIRHSYGSDPAAVVFDAIAHAKSKGADVVLVDTAGRSHSNANLMDELKKVVRVNRPDLKILVLDSLAGNDIIEQGRKFDKAVGVDCIILSKLDVNTKGGAVLSASHVLKKPILFLGTGQGYDNLDIFEPKRVARELLE